MRAINFLSLPKKELVQLGLTLLVVLVMTEDFVELSHPTINIVETSVFLVAVFLTIELFRMRLSRYSIFFAIVAFCYNPISQYSLSGYGWIRPNAFIALVAIFVAVILQNYSFLKKDKKRTDHVRN